MQWKNSGNKVRVKKIDKNNILENKCTVMQAKVQADTGGDAGYE